jgi:transcriptional regulator with XRE-family HTH domain
MDDGEHRHDAPSAEAISKARLAMHLTQAELAKRVGVKGQTLSRWEARKQVPSKKHCKALIHAITALNVEVAAELARAVNDPSIAHVPAPPEPVSVADALGGVIVELSDALESSRPAQEAWSSMRCGDASLGSSWWSERVVLIRRARASGFRTTQRAQRDR